MASLLGLQTKIVLSSTLDVHLTKVDRLAEICRPLGAGVYLSGRGGRNYQDESQFHERGIKLAYSDFVPRPYPRLWGDLCPDLSIADTLFNLGPAATAALCEIR